LFKNHNEKDGEESENDTVNKEEKEEEEEKEEDNLELKEEDSRAKEEEERREKEEEEERREKQEQERVQEEEKKKRELLRSKDEEDRRLKEIEEQKLKEEDQNRKEEQRREEDQKKKEEELRKKEEELKEKEEEQKRKEEEQREEEEERKKKEKRKEDKRKEEEKRKEDQRKEEDQRRKDKEHRRKEEEKKKEEEQIKEEKKRKERKDDMKREEDKKKEREERREKEDEAKREERKRKEEDRKKREKEQRREAEHQMNDEKMRLKEDRENKEPSVMTDRSEEKLAEVVQGKESSRALTGDDDGNNDNIKGKVEICSRNDNVPENGVTNKEETADDTLVMEIDQNDMVPEDPAKEEGSKQEEIISAEPGQITSLRKLGGSKGSVDPERKKRGWGASRSNRPSSTDDVEISSNSLKDLVPDLKPLLSNEAILEEEAEQVDSDADVAGPKIPDKVKKDGEPTRKRKKIHMEDLTETNIILIVNLTRPFTVNQLKEMLKRTGTIEDFWIDRIKSKCCAKFSSVDQASETRMALDGVAWPQGNPKTLRVSFASEEGMTNLKEGSNEVLGRLASDGSGRMGDVREWDRNKKDQEKEREVSKIRREVKVDKEEKVEETEMEKKLAGKSLEDLFKKTTAVPAVYWKPLSEEEQKAKEEERNKKVMEAQIMREMMDTKESLQRSKRLVPVRRRSRSSSGSSR